MVGVDSHGIPRAPRYLGAFTPLVTSFRIQDCHPLWSPVPEQFNYDVFCGRVSITTRRNVPQPSYNNGYHLTLHEFLARPLSLTTTEGITFVLFSSRYLDVSVHAVRFSYPMNSDTDIGSSIQWVAPFRNPRVKA